MDSVEVEEENVSNESTSAKKDPESGYSSRSSSTSTKAKNSKEPMTTETRDEESDYFKENDKGGENIAHGDRCMEPWKGHRAWLPESVEHKVHKPSDNHLIKSNILERKTYEKNPDGKYVKNGAGSVVQPKQQVEDFAMKRARRQSVCFDALSKNKKEDRKLINPKAMHLGAESESLNLTSPPALNKAVPEKPAKRAYRRKTIYADSESSPLVAVSKKPAKRAYRRKTICILSKNKKEVRKSVKIEAMDLDAESESLNSKSPPVVNKAVPEKPAKRAYRRKTICAEPTKPRKSYSYKKIVATFAVDETKHDTIEAFDNLGFSQLLKLREPCQPEPSDFEQFVIIDDPPKIVHNVTLNPKKRKRSMLDDSVVESKNSAKRQKANDASSIAPKSGVIVEEVIEEIWYINVEKVNNEFMPRFLVKWDGFPPSENTLEPFEHVSHAECLQEYVQRKFEMHQERVDEAMANLLKEAHGQYENYLKKPKTFILKKLSKFDVLKYKCHILGLIYTYDKIPTYSPFLKQLRYQNILYQFYLKSQREKTENRGFLTTIMKKEKIYVEAENSIDYEPVPSFTYLMKVENPFKKKLKFGCECPEGCSKDSNCCPKMMKGNFVYDVDERIFALSHQMIVECNEYCKCDKKCPNRPKKTQVSLYIFKTANRGWALKTLDAIPSGTFVVEYVGELIDQSQVKKRTRIYNKTGVKYLFDLDYNVKGEATFSIDATHKGNLSRFINHSCAANLQTWPATSCNENRDMHRLYYISLRDIRAGEELTVDYSGGIINPKPPKDAIPCKCGSESCKGYIF